MDYLDQFAVETLEACFHTRVFVQPEYFWMPDSDVLLPREVVRRMVQDLDNRLRKLHMEYTQETTS